MKTLIDVQTHIDRYGTTLKEMLPTIDKILLRMNKQDMENGIKSLPSYSSLTKLIQLLIEDIR